MALQGALRGAAGLRRWGGALRRDLGLRRWGGALRRDLRAACGPFERTSWEQRPCMERSGSFRMGNSVPTVGLSDDATADQIQEIISDNCVVIFSKTTCPYCKMAKQIFEDINVNYTAVELDMYPNGSQFQDILEQMTGGRTVPRVFVNGTFVGGGTDTKRLHEEGKLLPLVHQCQVKGKSQTAI